MPSSREEGRGSPFCDWGWWEGRGALLPRPPAAPAGPPSDEYTHFIRRRGEAVRAGVPSAIIQGNFRIVAVGGSFSVYFILLHKVLAGAGGI